ncbi:hypothetical protein PVL29_007682 [Vitis rotundifolia]|uniref:DDE Tnp4 domain-containing protein n=1 Tax=Vitis rotundifolia TaxID=103349 RepID=A0AA39DV38_VITRO|nr:hypothetical protein PVL29_007682 [Vitis rotundifolia]
MSGYLGPYKGERYHLPDFRQGSSPKGKKEISNHRHSSLRCTIERMFAVLKNRWRMLQEMHRFPLEKTSFGSLLLNPSIGNQSEIESSISILAEIARILVVSPLQPTLGFHHSPLNLLVIVNTKAKERELQAKETELKKKEWYQHLYDIKYYLLVLYCLFQMINVDLCVK